MEYKTPIQPIPLKRKDVHLYIKREDLLPLSFGGNKVRIACEYFADMTQKGKNCIIAYGNARSNLCRVIANIARMRGIPCYVISPHDDNDERCETFNSLLVSKCNANIRPCKKTDVAQTVEAVMAECRSMGYAPYYINGDKYGKGNEAVPVRAYEKVYQEICSQEFEMGINFDYIFLATGTGMTQSGLVAGKHKQGGCERIIGISIARTQQQAMDSVRRYLRSSVDAGSTEEDIYVTDTYLEGGYGCSSDKLKAQLIQIYKMYGIALDPVYSGKAFSGMLRYIDENHVTGNVLFIHTGSAPLFFDFLKNDLKTEDSMQIKICKDKRSLVRFLTRIDGQMPTALSDRVLIDTFAEKVLANGLVLAIEDEGSIVSAALFYCNDKVSGKAYLTLLGTLQAYERKGYAKRIMLAMEKMAKEKGMNEVHLDTDAVNKLAISFYNKLGYRIMEKGERIHMIKGL